jgi:hypothetical protein
LADALTVNRSLSSLCLSGNSQIGEAGGMILSDAIKVG